MEAAALWARYVDWLRAQAPASYENLAPPASESAIAEVERTVGHALPDGVKAVWRANDGQRATLIATRKQAATVCLPTLSFLSTALVVEVWMEWDGLRRQTAPDQLAALQSSGQSPEPGVVRPLYTCAGWIPLWSDPTRADYIGLDLDPDEKGQVGQIINFGRDEETHFRFAGSFEELLRILLEEVEGGAWRPSRMPYGDRDVAWLGEPKAHFFNALHRRWEQRAASLPVTAKTPAAVFQEARARKSSGDLAGTVSLLSEAAAAGKANAPMLALLAQVHGQLGQHAQAESVYRAVNEKAPRLVEHWLKRAENLSTRLGDRPGAERVLREALGALPDHPQLVKMLETLKR